ncbi:MGDG synthase family glycosyltransferase [Bacillus methanolicus]|uniref:Monogalactosyldiacylglycerol synthase n=1 Tax=Bacillus methanolicus (strain MGA3 / ATCC 53907) TaxID=796606 RepID=I3E3A3_BACMM|nr:glycosyltransferase [Bacillus methanolicus]AIE58939.1 Monogalactosyldiacylglycerol synthase [Bacillus methanolicus MGA3]EIJ80974.1 Monogalactosyldiacylglycerol synthase [Bacillus methanolicus MGA3]
MNKKVIILSECIGNGHTKAAEALMQGISHLAPSIHTQILEAGQVLHPITTKLLVGSYLKMNSLSPSLWRKMYHYKHNVPLSNWKKFIIYLMFHRQIEDLLEQEKPNLIICTHPFTTSSISRLKRLGYPFTLCTVLTDFHVHGAWVHSEVDVYLVSSEDAYNQLINMGVPKNHIAVTGMPIRSNFWIKKNKQEMRKKLRLKNIPSVMVMGGGLGLGGIKELSHALLKWKENIQIIICTGNNETLRRTLSRNEKFHHPHVRILGFVDLIDEWMEATDLLITKAGGLTCFEAMSKGLPMYIYQPFPGHEEKNCEFLVNNHLAIKIDDITNLDKVIEKLLFSPEEMKSLYDRMRKFQLKIDPLASAEFIVNQFL